MNARWWNHNRPAPEASSEGASSRKEIDAEAGRPEADKERTVPQHTEEYFEWISSQKWTSDDAFDSRG